MHVPAAGDRPAWHNERLIDTKGLYSDAYRFWPVEKFVKLLRGDHHRHSKTRARPHPPARRPETGSST